MVTDMDASVASVEDRLWAAVGGAGRWQWFLWLSTAVAIFFNALFAMGAMFLAADPDHWCHVDALTETNWTTGEIKQISLPSDSDGSYSQCYYYNRNYSYLATLSFQDALADVSSDQQSVNEVYCSQWDYEKSLYQTTAVTEWNLVCDRTFLLSSIQGTYMVGVFIGALIFGIVSDRCGRRITILISVTGHAATSISAAFAPNYLVFVACRFADAMCMSGIYDSCYVLLMETIASKRRALFGMLFQVPFSTGYMALALIAFFVRDWRVLELAISVPSTILFAYIWYKCRCRIH